MKESGHFLNLKKKKKKKNGGGERDHLKLEEREIKFRN
jgi:hypothetical protein